MNFDFSEDQQEIKRTAHDLLAQRSTFARVREAAEAGTYDSALWPELSELGWPGIAVGEDSGGGGLGTVELAILCEELGYAMAGLPLLATAAAALVLEQAGSDDQRSRWLGRLASGEATAGFGTSELLLDGVDADVLVVLDREGRSARLVDRSDAEVTALETIDPTRRYARLEGDASSLGEALDGDVTAGVDRATAAVSAELVGIAQRALDMTVAYVKDRKQFDTPVGAFQAVGHRCAQMLKDTEGARSATYFAAWAADADPERLPEAAALAKAASSDGAREATASAIQAHGGIGFTWEADVHWLYKRAQMDAALLGGAGTHRARLARIVADRIRSAGADAPVAGIDGEAVGAVSQPPVTAA